MTMRAPLVGIVFAASCLLGSGGLATAEPHTVLYSDPILPQERVGNIINANVTCTVLNVSDRPIDGTIEIFQEFRGTPTVTNSAAFVDVKPLQVTATGGSFNV